ncbi:MAG: hypothetical protein WBX81_04510, partial [Nitrososphaeraceae archaeon]
MKNISLSLSDMQIMIYLIYRRVQCLSDEIINLEGQKRNSMNKVILWNAQLSDLGKAMRNQQLKRMG